MPLLHPANIMRGRWKEEPSQAVHVERMVGYAFKGIEPYMPDYTAPPPNSNLNPNVRQIIDFILSLDSGVAIDIESAGPFIICVGLTAIDIKTYEVGGTICIRFRSQGGQPYWKQWQEHLDVVEALSDMLGNPHLSKVFQNGITFDVPELQALGFEVVGPYIDTMHLAHAAYPEVPKGLQYLSTLHLGMPVWKTLVDEDETEGKG